MPYKHTRLHVQLYRDIIHTNYTGRYHGKSIGQVTCRHVNDRNIFAYTVHTLMPRSRTYILCSITVLCYVCRTAWVTCDVPEARVEEEIARNVETSRHQSQLGHRGYAAPPDCDEDAAEVRERRQATPEEQPLCRPSGMERRPRCTTERGSARKRLLYRCCGDGAPS